MYFSKYKKEYKKFRNNCLKTYFILENLIYDIKIDKTLEKTKTKSILLSLNCIKEKYIKLIDNIESFDFKNIKEKVNEKKCINNLVVLPLYEDIDIYVNPDENINDIFNCKKDI